MGMTVTVDAANAGARIFIDWSAEAGEQRFGTLFRIVDDINNEQVPVRGLFGTQLLGEQAYVFDHEAPLDRNVWYLAASGPDNVTFFEGAFVIPSNGSVWMKDPGRPWADLRADLCETPTRTPAGCETLAHDIAWVGLGNKTRAMDAGVFQVLDRERAADVFARRKDVATTANFLTRSLTAIDEVYELYTVGGPLLYQLPAIYGFADRYMQPGDLVEEYISLDQRKPYRRWNAPLTSVDQPIGEPQGTDATNWCTIDETYATFGELATTGFTWGNVIDGSAATPPAPTGYGAGLYGDGPYGD